MLLNILEPELCQQLIALYEAHGREETGVMREVEGKTVEVRDHGHKRRHDYIIEDEQIIRDLRSRFLRRVIPELKRNSRIFRYRSNWRTP